MGFNSGLKVLSPCSWRILHCLFRFDVEVVWFCLRMPLVCFWSILSFVIPSFVMQFTDACLSWCMAVMNTPVQRYLLLRRPQKVVTGGSTTNLQTPICQDIQQTRWIVWRRTDRITMVVCREKSLETNLRYFLMFLTLGVINPLIQALWLW
jgi:hypothetical protein